LIAEGPTDRDQIIDTHDRVERLRAACGTSSATATKNVNRTAIYDASRKRGEDHLLASFEVRDLIDFTMTGK